ncbi:MAG: PIN domain-containing protein [Trueperaceae bacterium]
MLVDTSVWIDHLQLCDSALATALEQGRVQMHPYVVGELACGNITNRAEVLGLLGALPAVPTATHDEVMDFIERRDLMGRGLGYVDVHLLASVFLQRTRLWTRDKRLARVAVKLEVAFTKET